MSSSQQDTIKASRGTGYSSPRNLEKGLQMLPLAAAAAAGPSASSNGFAFSGLPVLPAAEDTLFSPMPSPRTSASLYPSPGGISKTPVPSLALAQQSPFKAAPKPASKPALPLPVVVYKPKPKPIDVAFGYRTAPAASPRNSKSPGSVLDGSSGSAAGGLGQRLGSRNSSRRGSRADTEPSGAPGNSSSSTEARGGSSKAGGAAPTSRIPKTPRSRQAEAAASSSSHSNNSGSRIPKPSSARSNAGPRGGRRAGPRASELDDEDTIFVDCAADGQNAEAAGSGRSGGTKATFNLSFAISAVFNPSSNGTDGGNSEGISPRRLLQTAAAALSRSLMSSGLQGSGSATKQQRRAAEKAAHSSSSTSTRPHSPRPAAAAPSGTAAASRKAPPTAAATSTALVVPRSPRAATAAKAGSSKSAAAAAPRSSPATSSSLSIVQVSAGSHAAASPAPTAWTSTALTCQDSDTAGCVTAAANNTGTTIIMQLQGSFPESPSRATGRAGRAGVQVEELFASLEPSEDSSSDAWRSASEVESWRGDSDNQALALRTSPTALFGQAAAAATLPAAAATAAGRDGEVEAIRFHSAGTGASWSAASSETDIGSTGAVEEWPLKQQQQQQQQQGARVGSKPDPAAAAAAAGCSRTAAAAAAVGRAVPLSEEREVMLTISPRALPLLAARALSKTPVRLVITPDAVWGDTAAFSAAKSPSPSPRGGRKSPLLKPIKAVKRAIMGQQQSSEAGEGEGETPTCAGGKRRSSS